MKPLRGEKAPTAIISTSLSARSSRSTTGRLPAISSSLPLYAPMANRFTSSPPCGAMSCGPEDAPEAAAGADAAWLEACAGMKPSDSSLSRMARRLSSFDSFAVSTVTSGDSGASYGSSIPVKPLISPASAFL